MITVTLNRKAETLSLCVTGHAGFASMGQDIVCAAASILVYTAAELALDMERRGQLRRAPVLHLKPGDAQIRFTPDAAGRQRAETGLETVGYGFSLLAKKYPRYIRLA